SRRSRTGYIAFAAAGHQWNQQGACMGGKLGNAADKRLDSGGNQVAPAAAGEYAVMAAFGSSVMLPVGIGQVGAQPVGGTGLALSGDVIELAFYGKQRGTTDGGGIHPYTIDNPAAGGQLVLLEDDPDGVQIELGRHVEHGIVFVIEAAVGGGVLSVALEQAEVEVIVRLHMAVGIHGDEPGMLQKPGIDPTARAGVTGGHLFNEVVLEPAVGFGRGQAIDLGR